MKSNTNNNKKLEIQLFFELLDYYKLNDEFFEAVEGSISAIYVLKRILSKCREANNNVVRIFQAEIKEMSKDYCSMTIRRGLAFWKKKGFIDVVTSMKTRSYDMDGSYVVTVEFTKLFEIIEIFKKQMNFVKTFYKDANMNLEKKESYLRTKNSLNSSQKTIMYNVM